ncbi:hypothetical protein ABZ721_23735 [Streptomyces sp. NPDC006733]|uniref:hypothetical protein n=1 Tax=Streptomyces sp. NPDC006733 TaxID=3155460 RepID=UPI0033E80ADB
MALLEARESAAQVRVEDLRGQAERVLAELREAEGVLERRVIARVELAEAMAEPGREAEEPVRPVPVPAALKVPVAGAVVPRWREGLTVGDLAPDYQRLLGVLEAESDGAGLRAKELAGRLGLELTPAKVEGVRSKANRLTERGWLAQERPGVFTSRRAAG